MQAVSESWAETLQRYLASRLPGRVYVPCAALLVGAALAGGRTLSVPALALCLLPALTLLLQFRLLDDLADRPNDRRAHPYRVLVRAVSLAPFRVLLGGSCLFNLALLALQGGPACRLTVFLLLTAVYLLWYGFLRNIVTSKTVGHHFVAVKYPAFVFLLSGDGADHWSLALTMGLIYLSFTIYEVLHDRDLQTTAGAGKALWIGIGALCAVAALMTFRLIGGAWAIAALQGSLAVVSLLAMGEAFGRRRLHLRSTKAGYLVFVLAFALCINFSLGVRL